MEIQLEVLSLVRLAALPDSEQWEDHFRKRK